MTHNASGAEAEGMTDPIPFNINQNVRVRLTDRGRQELQRQRDELNALIVARGGKRWHGPPVTEVDGWSRWQLWDLMERLGHLCGLGCAPPFETEIVFEVARANPRPEPT